MRAAIFVGPTLPPRLRPTDPLWEWRPPVRQGDVYRVAQTRPDAIGIIDGYFEIVPTVWHKEILWAMAQGIPVYGAASIGALRAAELDVFGMRRRRPYLRRFPRWGFTGRRRGRRAAWAGGIGVSSAYRSYGQYPRHGCRGGL